ncbi:hypothetical protein AQUCO_02000346v1 [Aquilegia coerulea]|uniref:DNA-directed RNA polymerase III subunit RPC4 n=1 Tax=Aquilegia coerulea TaxID=218851 RepID=A0A2G5DH62_AQUCA|nr:hypothetical protein AQUCO_02000346v1 [Aquilegia coerulea]
MEPEQSAQTRKVRFAPKAQPRKPKPNQPKTEVKEEIDASHTIELLRRINDGAGRGKPKVEKKAAPVQVAFGQSSATGCIQSYGRLKNKALRSQDGNGASVKRIGKEYKEPWDYYSYYPITVPLRRPYLGNPDDLNKEEFEGASASIDHENMLNPAKELGLMDESAEQRMLFLQLPASLPFEKPAPEDAETTETAKESKLTRPIRRPEKGCSLEELPPGFMGKMLVYKSGAVKLKLGDTLYDITPGSDCIFAQDVVAVNTKEKHCCVVGELNKRAIVTPDVDSLLQAVGDL